MVTTKLTTADELLAMPDDGWRYELIEGVLVRMSPSAPEPGTIASVIVARLVVFVEPRGLGRVFTAEAGFVLARDPDTVVAPDVAFTRAECLPPRREWRHFLPPPDLAVEVVSPSDRGTNVADKVARYLAAGVPLVWIFWPDPRTVSVHAPGREAITLGEGDELDGEDVLPGFRLPVADVFR